MVRRDVRIHRLLTREWRAALSLTCVVAAACSLTNDLDVCETSVPDERDINVQTQGSTEDPGSLGGVCMGAAAENPVGQPCGCDDDCGGKAGACIPEPVGIPHGMCERKCEKDEECGAGAHCATLLSLCLLDCETSEQCPIGRACTSFGCFPHCQRDDECLGGECDLYTGCCQPTTVNGKKTGEACADDTECRSYYCLNGACVSSCVNSIGACPDEALCTSIDDSDYGICFARCTGDTDCAPGTTCQGDPKRCRL